MALPRRIRIIEDGSDEGMATYRVAGTSSPRLVIERRWFTPVLFGAVIFCTFWDGFLVLWYGMALASKHPPAMTIFFPLMHVGAGVAITYSTLCGFVNRTRITVENGVLTIAHGPLPWRGNRAVAIENLRQLFCEQIVGSKGRRSYRLNALLKTGEKAVLLSALPDPDSALCLEGLLEKRLGIADEPVAGEHL